MVIYFDFSSDCLLIERKETSPASEKNTSNEPLVVLVVKSPMKLREPVHANGELFCCCYYYYCYYYYCCYYDHHHHYHYYY